MKPKLLLVVCCALEVYAMFALHRAMANSNDFYFGDAASDVEGNDDKGIENEHESDTSDSSSGEETNVEGTDESLTSKGTKFHGEEDTENTEEWTKGTGNSNEKSCQGQATEVFVGMVVGIVYAVL